MSKSLYDKYGGFKTVSRVVITFYELVLDSDVVGHHFDDIDMGRLIDHQTKFMSSLLGGPVSFGDERLRTVHRGLIITHAEFDEIITLLSEALQMHGMEQGDINMVRQAIETKRGVIVAREPS
ncbi:group 1 truncated hemoglobin [Epibacterium sp. SM1969]|uniref:Group 1 truncated hemoglobin n=1 Tax=Tritonibacter aquimaris TaxID=2663379 RepID=A0A844ASK0_9RHOB|nr:group 1 truncated hemoglobin [Tritonibacter aquimaris]MQY41364.1 group 1 truncated hemoglobin [Tritonibacter aquimaris]